MPTVRLTETHILGVYQGSNGCLYEREDGGKSRCSRCGRWSRVVYRWADQRVCGRHVRLTRRDRIRLTTTFACRTYQENADELPPGRVLRRGDELAVAGPPERVGKHDKFIVPEQGGYVLVPRSRWAWA